MNIYFAGDLHGSPASLFKFYVTYIKGTPKEKEENWIVCLGDAGFLYYLNEKDDRFKADVSYNYPFKYFVIRGNHEERASNRAATESDKWEEVELFGGKCLREKAFPKIYYAADEGGIYNIAGRKTLVVPGAYSVDKQYRQWRGWAWFPDEQMKPYEMMNLESVAAGQYFDLVLSHTCPYQYRPTDLFLGCIDQSTVDNTMELWMSQLAEKITWDAWLWGHYHADRVEAPHCEILYSEIENLEDIEERWARYDETGELDWWIPKSPIFHMFEGK